ncbi:MAG TPA: ThuA domain-containing protein [Phnomibacter sp.]|nr:ThuA domain-containing protein [Phnomibacter sp.]
MKLHCLAIAVLWIGAAAIAQKVPKKLHLLVFSKTTGYRHESIAAGKQMFLEMAAQYQWQADTTEDASYFTPESLQQYQIVVFMNTTGNVLDEQQQQAFENYIKAGGRFLGIHAATDTEYQWPWFNQLVGAYFASHPKPQQVDYVVLDAKHPAVSFWAPKVNRLEEIYDFKQLQKDRLHFIMRADENSYQGGKMGEFHPAAWCQKMEGGRAFYTALGHHPQTYADKDFRRHIVGGIIWLMRKK